MNQQTPTLPVTAYLPTKVDVYQLKLIPLLALVTHCAQLMSQIQSVLMVYVPVKVDLCQSKVETCARIKFLVQSAKMILIAPTN